VVITRCDRTYEDVNDAGELIYELVMKSDSDRAMMSKYTYDQIVQLEKKQCNDQLEVLTVSVRYAEEHDNNADELEKSGMNALFRKLTKLTQSEGVRLKEKTPGNNLRAFVNHIHTGSLSVEKLRSDLAPLETSIAKQRRQLKQKQASVIGPVLTELNPLIEDAVRKENMRRDIKALKKTCIEHLQRIVSNHVDMALREIFNETQSAVDNAVRFQELKQLPEFRDNFKEISVETKSGFWGNLVKALIGPAATLPFIESIFTGTRTERVNLGNNTLDVIAETTKIFNEAAKKAIDTAFAEIDNNFLKPIEQQAQTVNVALDRFVNILEKEVYPPDENSN
jgi:hypothetical protein